MEEGTKQYTKEDNDSINRKLLPFHLKGSYIPSM